jgi:hypothetical protein
MTTLCEEFVSPFAIPPFANQDITIFSPADFEFPTPILDKSQHPGLPVPVPDFPPLLEWQRIALEIHPRCLAPNSDLLFAAFTFCGASESPLFEEKVASYAGTFPARSVPYNQWLVVLLRTLPANARLAAVILSTVRWDMFQFESRELEQTAFRDLVLLYFGVMLRGPLATRSLRKLLIDWNEVEDEAIVWLAEQCCDVALELPLQSVALWIGAFPMDGCGAKILYGLGTRFCQMLLGLNPDGIPAMEQFAGSLSQLKVLCEAGNDGNFLKASALLAVIEKVVVVSIRLRMVNRRTIQAIVGKLKFSFSHSDIGHMTRLKEQLHVTRTQIEMLSEIDFRI